MGRSKLSNIERRHKARSSVQSKLLNMEHTTSQNWPDLKVPTIALGTWKSPQEQTKQAIVTAVKAGFRFLDTANDYDNEHFIGDALEELFKEGVVKREDLFIQSKLWNSNHRPEHVRPDLEATLKDLKVSYIDSFVIHWPMAVLQNESHPYLQEKDLRDFCKINGIIFQAYSSLGSADRPWRKEGSITSGAAVGGHEVLQNPTLLGIAAKHGVSAAQVVLRWHVQMGGAAVCKSVTPSRIIENYKLWHFKL